MDIAYRKTYYYAFLFVNILCFHGISGATRARQGNIHRGQSNSGSHVVYVSPVPGSAYLTPSTNIIIRSDESIDAASLAGDGLFTIVGSLSGDHAGNAVLASDRRTIIFKPIVPFSLGEIVSVSIVRRLLTADGDTISLNPFSFRISGRNLNADKALIAEIAAANSEIPDVHPESPTNQTSRTMNEPQLKNEFEGLPANFPTLKVTQSDNPSPGYIFLSTISSPISSDYGHYLIMADNQGSPVFYKYMGSDQAWDFTMQPTGVLTYSYPFIDPTRYVMNTSFQIIDSFKCGNGYIDDGHEMKILPDGNVILLADDYEQIDMSKIVPGGDTNAVVLENVIQELDKNKNVIFQWRTFDHFNITDGIGTSLTTANVDPFHCNAIEMDQDGNILLSSRYLSEITKIDIETGDIIWRLGGKNNQFDFVNDPIGFSYQHDIRRLPNGDITLMDNGNKHTPTHSRAVEYKLDEVNKTATLAWQFEHSPNVYNSFMGDVQRLANGNTLIGWGGAPTPTMTEVRPDGSIALEMTFPFDSALSYRAYRFPFLFITSPTVSDTLRGGDVTTLRWKSSGVDTVDVDCSTDGGNSWSGITVNYPADADSIDFAVPALSAGSDIKFRVIQSGATNRGVTFLSDAVSIVGVESVPPSGGPYTFSLSNNYPNPFNPSTTIDYEISSGGFVTLKIYDILGRDIETLVDGAKVPGKYSATFDGSKFSSGVYFYRLTTSSGFTKVNKMVLEK
ncbi:MAG TPA: aryl-sulfate sulfotransferase [Candidatus Acidoferrales bacterium]|nr:aryl-sulfate sulfotransferase [Candidatus Acidoferrales bacterium]